MRVASLSVLAGLVGGVILDAVAFWVARDGPVGDGWSFRGNGALIVPFGLGPACLAGGWAALARHYRRDPGWLRFGVAAGVIGALPAAASVVVLLIAGTARQRASDLLTFPTFAWPLVAVLLAALVAAPRAEARSGTAVHAIAALGFTVALVAGFYASAVVLPPGS